MKAYRATGTKGGMTAETPKKAALKYFEAFPTSRKCDIVSGEINGAFFTVTYGRGDNWPTHYRDITKKSANDLPDGE